MFKNFVFGLALISIIACGSKPRVSLDEENLGLKPSAQHEVIASEVANLLENHSYKKVPMTDSLSAIVFDNLLKSMDQGRNYLLQSDVDQFQKYKNTVSQDFRKGDLSAPFFMFNVYSDRYLQCMEYALTQVDVKHDFTVNENYVAYREKLPYFKTDKELKDQWRKRVKYDLLNLRLTTTDKDSVDMEKHKETLRKRYKNLISQAKKTNSNDAFQLIMTALTDAVDPHTTYYNPSFAQAFNEGMSNTFEGIGARLQMENEMVTIKEVIAGGPAFKDKSLNVDDRIIAVAQGDGEFDDIIGWRLDAAVAKIKGPKGTVVRLKIIPAGQELTAQPKIVSLNREKIVVEEESALKEIKMIKGEDGKTYKIGLIKLPKFYIDFAALRARDPNYKSTTRDVRLILDTLKQEKVDAVVLDLRQNGGGSLQEAIELTGLFIDKGPVVQVRDTRNRVQVDSDEEPGVAWDGPFGVMINRFSASASEIFAGAIQDYGRGIVLGSQSYGKGTVQSAIEMSRFISATNKLLLKAKGEDKDPDTPNGAPEYGQINITMGKFYRVTGSSTQHKGVSPDVSFPTQYTAEKFGESSEPSALPWDQIKPTNYKRVADLTAVTQKLNAVHETRMKKSPEYKYLLEDIEEFKKLDNVEEISLNQVELQKERDRVRAKNRARINKGLELRGLPLWKEGQPQPKVDFDFVLDESLNVMADFIRLGK
ncbi:carboxy terminal-processing peptidase [Sphingobacterium psychroaquaticum]|uniref:Carboxyl-terminal processing protease n=1 Tax=Sphingobacterium psychroaquaticum TaxID=561061 RepID=A0A1X7L167_9SPHI|nr:carboxy terminal-processing peptidase [Sphingobacterium psychroaquaticum]SMG47578.1 carboxyl-terminal processing protease [Sphingobacterium psychroaquaticum]